MTTEQTKVTIVHTLFTGETVTASATRSGVDGIAAAEAIRGALLGVGFHVKTVDEILPENSRLRTENENEQD